MKDEITVRTCLWFDHEGEEAATLYVSLLPDSWIESVSSMATRFILANTPFMALNGGPQYKPTPAASIFVSTRDQVETDHLWNALISQGGAEGRCGWLTDRYGVSWQIVPGALGRCLNAEDTQAAKRALDAMMAMKKIDIEKLQAATWGETAGNV